MAREISKEQYEQYQNALIRVSDSIIKTRVDAIRNGNPPPEYICFSRPFYRYFTEAMRATNGDFLVNVNTNTENFPPQFLGCEYYVGDGQMEDFVLFENKSQLEKYLAGR